MTQTSRTAAAPAARPDTIALAVLLISGLLAVPLLFATRLPQPLLALIAIALALVFGVRAFLTRTWLPTTPANWPNLLFLLLLPLGLWISADKAVSWPVVYKVLASMAVFYGIAGLAGTRWLHWLPWAFLVAAALLVLAVLLGTNWATAKLPWIPEAFYAALPSLSLSWRSDGIHPNLAGNSTALMLFPALTLALWAQPRALRRVAGIIAAVLAVALVLSQSRGAWLGAAAALLVLPGLRQRRWLLIPLMAGGLGLLAAVVVGPQHLQGWLFPASSLADAAATNTLPGRLELWTRAIAMLRDFGLTGIGPGQFEPVLMVLYPPFFTSVMGGFQHAHNQYLQMALDFGVLGLVAWLGLCLTIGTALLAALRAQVKPADQTLGALAAGIFASLIVLTVHSLVEAPLVAPPGHVLVFALLGMGAALATHQLRPPSAATPTP